MLARLLLSAMLFCPVTSDTTIIGYHCWAYVMQIGFTAPQPCPPGLCKFGIAEGTLPHIPFDLTCTVNAAGHSMEMGDPVPGTFVMFSAEPEWDPNVQVCSPGGCATVWWEVNPDYNQPCVCPGGEC